MAKKKEKNYAVPIILGVAAAGLGIGLYNKYKNKPVIPTSVVPGGTSFFGPQNPTSYNPNYGTNWFTVPGSSNQASGNYSPYVNTDDPDKYWNSGSSVPGDTGSWFGGLIPSSTPSSSLPRGLRNKNPLNLVISNNAWQGKVPVSQNTDGKFEQFTDQVKGWRAGIKNMKAHHNNGKDTIRSLTAVWAPKGSGEGNNPENYAIRVSQGTGIGIDAPFPFTSQFIIPIAREFAVVENGENFRSYIKENEIATGYAQV